MAERSLASNVTMKTILNIFNIAVPLLITRHVYHVLGPVNMGFVQWAQTIYNFFMMVGLFGIYQYAVRGISSHRNDTPYVRNLFKNMMVWSFISNLFALAIYVIFIIFIMKKPVLKDLSWIFAVNLLGQCFYLEWYNEAREEFRFITWKTMAVRLTSVVMILMFVNSPDSLYIYTAILVSIGILNYIFSFIYAQGSLHMGVRELFSGLKLKPYFWPLFTIMVLNGSAYLFTMADIAILGKYVGETSVSFFSIGNRMCEMMWTLMLSVVFATLPRLSLYLREERHLYHEGVLKVMRMLMFVAMPCGVALWMLGPELVDFFGGDAYLPAIPVTRMFSIRFVLLALQGIMYNQIIFLHGYERMQLFLNLGCGLLNVVLNFCFVSVLTPEISLLCTIGCELIYIVVNYFFITNKLKITLGLFRSYNLRYLLVAMLLIPLIYGLQQCHLGLFRMLMATIPSCLVVYIGIMALLRDQAYMQLQGYVLRLLHLKK